MREERERGLRSFVEDMFFEAILDDNFGNKNNKEELKIIFQEHKETLRRIREGGERERGRGWERKGR